MEVTFVTNGGTSVSKLEDVEKLPTPLPATTKTNNIFVGWFYDSEFEIKAFSDDTISSNIMLYAKWYANMEDFFQDVADAIRSKTGETNPIKHTDFAYKIKTLQGGGSPISGENFVRFVSVNARTITPKYTNSGITLQYSVDSGATWTTISNGSETTSAKEHWFRGQATGTKSLFTSSNNTNAWVFSGSSDLEVYGNLNFLLCDTLGDEVAPTSLGNYCYSHMFYDCTSLTTAPELPATTLADTCYRRIFYGCTSLTTTPELPATTLANGCYREMFYNCTSLTTAPKLPVTTLEVECYRNMFYNCTSLTTAPELPATTLVDGCYQTMFLGCTSLTTAPELPATTLADSCYSYMFHGCSAFKVSSTKTGSYTYAWRIPTSGTASIATSWNTFMLTNTGGTFASNPTINTTYYVENEPV